MRKSASLAMVRGHGLDLWPHLLRQLALLVLVLLAVWIFRDRLIALDFANIRRSVGDLTPGQWVTACLATLTSFWAIGRYDDIVHGLSRTGVDPSRARASGMAAVGIAQFSGFGLLSGTLVRWRLVPELTLTAAFRVTAVVALSFVAGWSIVVSISDLIAGGSPYIPSLVSIAVLLVGLSVLLAPFASADYRISCRPAWR